MEHDYTHQLWLIYEQLKDAEANPGSRLDILERSRIELGQVINEINRLAEPNLYAALASAGAKGGAAKTQLKATAARENGKKGGRPAMTDEEKAIQQWFREKGFRVQFEIGTINVSVDPRRPNKQPNHNEKYALVERLRPGSTPVLIRKYKMNPGDNTVDSFHRAKQLFEADLERGEAG